MSVTADIFEGIGQAEATRLHDYLVYGEIPDSVQFIVFCDWMVLHECRHMGPECTLSVERLCADSLIDDTDYDGETGLRILGYSKLESLEEIQGLCGASCYQLGCDGTYRKITVGFPADHPSIEDQIVRALARLECH